MNTDAAAEAFNSTLKVELVHRHRFATRAEARIKISTWISDFYTTARRHTANDGLAPITFERQMTEQRTFLSELDELPAVIHRTESQPEYQYRVAPGRWCGVQCCPERVRAGG